MNCTKDISGENICMVDNVHGLFVYFLINPEGFKDTFYIVSEAMPQSVTKNLGKVFVFPSFDKLPVILRTFSRCLYYNFFKYTRFFKKESYGNIYGHDHLYFSNFFINNSSDFILIEDGLANYVAENNKNVSIFKKILLDVESNNFGYSAKIKKIILTGISEIPSEIKEKCHLIDINSLWGSISQSDKDYFLSMFTEGAYSSLRKVVIFTQPFSEHGIMTEDDKISMYRTIYQYYESRYSKDDICIKPHPRENTAYENYFSCKVIHSTIPGQIMLLIDKPEVIATIYSSVGYTSLDIKNEIWGTAFSDVLVSKVGYFPANFKAEGIEWKK